VARAAGGAGGAAGVNGSCPGQPGEIVDAHLAMENGLAVGKLVVTLS
jgi:hypothetical protein